MRDDDFAVPMLLVTGTPTSALMRPRSRTIPSKGFAVLRAPIDIPTSLPAVELSLPSTHLEDFTGMGKPGGRANGAGASWSLAPVREGLSFEARPKSPWRCFQGPPGRLIRRPCARRASRAK